MSIARTDRPVVITMGDPAGVGTDILLMTLAQQADTLPPLVVIDHSDRLYTAARHLGLDVPIKSVETVVQAAAAPCGTLCVLDVGYAIPYAPGLDHADTASAVIQSLDYATQACLSGDACAMVTLPIHKNSLYKAGFGFQGHTDYLAARTGTVRSVMMLTSPNLDPVLRVIPVTIHQPLSTVSQTITADLIVETAYIVFSYLRGLGYDTPRLAVTGLNPHAGESGSLGQEEHHSIQPAITRLLAEGLSVSGPLPADTVFHTEARLKYDAILCMYHDQALIPLKTLDFWGGVNVTLGLPFIRTSPDHGTARALAGSGRARTDSFVAAVRLAYQSGHASSAREAQDQTSQPYIYGQSTTYTRQDHAHMKQQRPAVLWMTGISGAGKTTIATLLETQLLQRGYHTFLLDGDNLRHSLNKDLGFTVADRVENIRRTGAVARLMADAGLVVIVALISPFERERKMVRRMMNDGKFYEIFIDTPLQDAEKRDVKGLYAKARAGLLKNFTGIDSPYERPTAPDIHIDTTHMTAQEATEKILSHVLPHVKSEEDI